MTKCEHKTFHVDAVVNRLEDVGRFHMDIKVRCVDCDTPFRFIGLPAGLDLNGASASGDAEEGRFAIAPKGEVIPAIEGGKPSGFSIRREDGL